MTRQEKGDENVVSLSVRLAEGSSPRSYTQPVARKISGTAVIDSRQGIERVCERLLGLVLRAYREADAACTDGDDAGVVLLTAQAGDLRGKLDEALDALEREL